MDLKNKNIKVIVIGGSAGSFQVVTQILSAIPKDFQIPIVFCLHRLKHVRHGFVEALNLKSNKTVVEPEDKEKIKPGGVYLAPANYHMFAEVGNTFALSTEEMVKFSRPSIDLTFETFSYVYRDKMLGFIITGANSDGADGIYRAHLRKATVISQDPNEATMRTMPDAAIKLMPDMKVMTAKEIINTILSLHK